MRTETELLLFHRTSAGRGTVTICSSPIHVVILKGILIHFALKRGCIFWCTPKTKEPPLPMRQTNPRRTPTRYFKASGRANRCYTLLKGDLEVVAAKGNFIIPRRNSTTGCSLLSYPGRLLLLLLSICHTLLKWFIYVPEAW